MLKQELEKLKKETEDRSSKDELSRLIREQQRMNDHLKKLENENRDLKVRL